MGRHMSSVEVKVLKAWKDEGRYRYAPKMIKRLDLQVLDSKSRSHPKGIL